MTSDELKVFAIETSSGYGKQVSDSLGVPLASHEEREFEDGEHKIRPLEHVRGCDVFVIHSFYSEPGQSVNDKLARLLFFIGALKDASASRVTAVVPYLAYTRKDKRTKPRDPLSTRYVAQLLESAGTDCLVTLDVHNLAAYQNAFRIPAEHLEAKHLLVDHLRDRIETDEKVAVISPDAGGIKRAGAFRDLLSSRLDRQVSFGIMEKTAAAAKCHRVPFMAISTTAWPWLLTT